jgi:hypothetical protein
MVASTARAKWMEHYVGWFAFAVDAPPNAELDVRSF